jgi:hypothetical protein
MARREVMWDEKLVGKTMQWIAEIKGKRAGR